jgi:hypothetical protein
LPRDAASIPQGTGYETKTFVLPCLSSPLSIQISLFLQALVSRGPILVRARRHSFALRAPQSHTMAAPTQGVAAAPRRRAGPQPLHGSSSPESRRTSLVASRRLAFRFSGWSSRAQRTDGDARSSGNRSRREIKRESYIVF